ncbi:hypothetical protein [Clostridium mediterraneense]|uniref:hypothetical protein n=1 Tax=Clostridium mediterraneense TaxID=1805472 RepID=UPI000829ACEE|nr:hypothetical protein [Clostridium mediterraneense]
MKLVETKLLIEEKDLLDLVKMAINIEELNINSLKFNEIKNEIELNGSIKKVFSVKFICILSLEKIIDKNIILKIKKIKALKVDMFSVIDKIINNKHKKGLKNSGVEIDGKKIKVNLDTLKKNFNFVDFNIKEITIKNKGILVEFNYINVDIEKLLLFKLQKKGLGSRRSIKSC